MVHISIDRVPELVQEYMVLHHLPKVKGTIKGMTIGYMAGRADIIIKNYIKDNLEVLEMLGTIKDGKINLEEFYNDALKALELNGGIILLPKIKYEMDSEDITEFYELAGKFAKRIAPTEEASIHAGISTNPNRPQQRPVS